MSERTGAVPAAASLAVASVLEGPPRRGSVIGAFPSAAYIAVEGVTGPVGGVVAVVTRRGIRLPNALVLPPEVDALGWVSADTPVTVGDGAVQLGAKQVSIGRWWDPRVHLPATDAGLLARRMTGLPDAAPGRGRRFYPGVAAAGELAGATRDLAAAVAQRDEPAAVGAAARLVGAGPGLTPSGDDVLAGALAAMRALGEAASLSSRRKGASDMSLVSDDWCRFVDGVGEVVVSLAIHRTPLLSAALLAHAARGEVAAPAGRLLLALAGRGAVPAAAAALATVGHTSGTDLTVGIRTGAAAVVAAARAGRSTR